MRCAIIATILAVGLASCAGPTVTDGCKVFTPIHGSKSDTERTRYQIDRHNARGMGACGWTP